MKIYLGLTCWIKETAKREVVINPEFFAAETAEEALELVHLNARTKVGPVDADQCTVYAAEINMDRLRETLNEADNKCLESEFLT